ncbi:glycosyltransferase family A protein [Dermabacteraceae bacterium P7006]
MADGKRRINNQIDVVIAVHDAARPIERCVASALSQNEPGGPRVGVIVVCHNIEVETILAEFTTLPDEGVVFLGLKDGIPSPAGPFNAGIAASDAEYVCTVGSDDYLERGALASWWRYTQDADGVEPVAAVLAPIRTDVGLVQTPLPRIKKPRYLDPVADYLALRTAPLGLLHRETLSRIGFCYTEGGLGNGEDIEPALRLWFSGKLLCYPYGASAYRVTADMGAARQTALIGSLERELRFLPALLAQSWIRELDARGRDAVLVKLLRLQVIPSLARRLAGSDQLQREDMDFLATTWADAVGSYIPRGLSYAEVSILRAVLNADVQLVMQKTGSFITRGGVWATARKVLTPRFIDNLDRQSRLRWMLRGLAVKATRMFNASS